MEKTDQYWTPILLWRKGSILDDYFTLFTLVKQINIGHIFYPGEMDHFFFNFTNAMILQF